MQEHRFKTSIWICHLLRAYSSSVFDVAYNYSYGLYEDIKEVFAQKAQELNIDQPLSTQAYLVQLSMNKQSERTILKEHLKILADAVKQKLSDAQTAAELSRELMPSNADNDPVLSFPASRQKAIVATLLGDMPVQGKDHWSLQVLIRFWLCLDKITSVKQL